jgi:hypothetical protein
VRASGRRTTIPGARAGALTLLLALATFGGVREARAQDWAFGIDWGVTFPLGNTYDYVESVGYRNFDIEFRHFRSEKFSLGFSGGWHVFYDELSGTQYFPAGAVTGTQIRYLNAIPVLATSHYYLGEPYARNQPYLGLGVGATNVLQRFEIGVASIETSNWHFAVAPEVGFMMGTGTMGETKIVIRGALHYAFAAGEDLSGDEAEYTYVFTTIGFSFR